MWSKLLPRDVTNAAQPMVFRTVHSHLSTPQRPTTPPSATSEADAERTQLRARVAELEQALTAQVAAARQTGFREGEVSGRTQAEALVKPVIDRLGKSLHDLIELKPRVRKELEEEAVRLSLAISKRILRRELTVDDSALHGLVQVAFERLGRNEVTRILVHPDHVTAIRDALAQLSTRQIEISADGSREKGTLVFETSRGSLDASVDSQLREIEIGLADRLKWR